MFRLVTEIRAPWPVKWRVVDASGAVTEAALTLQFVRVDTPTFRGLFQDGGADAPPADDALIEATNRRLFDRLVKGWADVVGADGAPLPFEDPHITTLLRFPGFAEAFGNAYTRFWMALPEEREKNSPSSPAGGPPATAAATGAAATLPAA